MLQRLIAWLKDDGLNHDWDGEWTDEDLANARRHLDDVEERSPDTLRWLFAENSRFPIPLTHGERE